MEDKPNILVCHPTLSDVFTPAKRRKVFKKRPDPNIHVIRYSLLSRLNKMLKVRKNCCNKECTLKAKGDFLDKIVRWRKAWSLTPAKLKRNALYGHLVTSKSATSKSTGSAASAESATEAGFAEKDGRKQLVLTATSPHIHYSFLGEDVCMRSFRIFTGIGGLHRHTKRIRQGLETYDIGSSRRAAPIQDQMRHAIWYVVQALHHQSPYAKRADVAKTWYVPFHQKVCLWRLVLALHTTRSQAELRESPESAESAESPESPVSPLSPQPRAFFTQKPVYSAFRALINSDEFSAVKFHRLVDIGRCPKCEYFQYKCASVPLALRSVWQDALSKHHLLQIKQKQIYAADRAKATAEFPNVELYLAMDCGSGKEFVYPHLSGADREGPNKVLDNVVTIPMKVCNGLVHGDTRSHVILSPGVIGATTSYTCECINILVNTAFMEHQDLPQLLTMQFDGASTNKNILVLTFLALYVLEGIVSTARARCELENHAHDLYDSFHSIHARRVLRSTFFTHGELIDIIKASHTVKHNVNCARPLVGHDVMVSDLFQVRDFWEWLAPGYSNPKTRPYALAHAAFSSFGTLRGYRDFQMKLESGSTDASPKVGLWAKAYMSTAEYEYIGTLITRESLDNVTRDHPVPPIQGRDVSTQKTARETNTVAGLRKAARGPYKEQFSLARLSDAIASCERNWSHFKDMPSALPLQALWLPSELAAEMRKRGLRGPKRSPVSSASAESTWSTEAAAAEELADIDPHAPPPPLQRRFHASAETFGFKKGKKVGSKPPEGKVLSDSEFKSQRVYPGSFVITRAAPNSHWSKSSPTLQDVAYWLWRVTKVQAPGTQLTEHSKPCAGFTYEAHLYRPTKGATGPWKPIFDFVGPQFLRTPHEKAEHKRKQFKLLSKGRQVKKNSRSSWRNRFPPCCGQSTSSAAASHALGLARYPNSSGNIGVVMAPPCRLELPQLDAESPGSSKPTQSLKSPELPELSRRRSRPRSLRS